MTRESNVESGIYSNVPLSHADCCWRLNYNLEDGKLKMGGGELATRVDTRLEIIKKRLLQRTVILCSLFDDVLIFHK